MVPSAKQQAPARPAPHGVPAGPPGPFTRLSGAGSHPRRQTHLSGTGGTAARHQSGLPNTTAAYQPSALGWLDDELAGVASYEATAGPRAAEIALAVADGMHAWARHRHLAAGAPCRVKTCNVWWTMSWSQPVPPDMLASGRCILEGGPPISAPAIRCALAGSDRCPGTSRGVLGQHLTHRGPR